MMIFVYWGILILCYFIASRLRNMASRFGFLDKSMMAAVYILVFLMGLRMGINRQVTSALATIGVQALAITLATIGGSILMIFLVRKALRLNRYGGLEKDAQEQEHRGKAGTSDLKSTVGIVSLVIAGIAVGRFGLVDQFPDHLEEISTITGNGLRADRYYRIRSRSFGNGGCKFKVGRSQSAGISIGDPGRHHAGRGRGGYGFRFLPQGKHRHLCRVRLVFLRSGHHHGGGASVRGGRCGGVSP